MNLVVLIGIGDDVGEDLAIEIDAGVCYMCM